MLERALIIEEYRLTLPGTTLLLFLAPITLDDTDFEITVDFHSTWPFLQPLILRDNGEHRKMESLL